MAKPKLNEDHMVQKSRPLLLMKQVPFSLGELKILDTYCSRINSHDETSRRVQFTASEYATLLGQTDVKLESLKKHTHGMLGKVIEAPVDGKFYQFVLFDEAVYEVDEAGRAVVSLQCSERAKKLFFSIDSLGYLRYRLQNVLALKSKYSVLLYLYLLDSRRYVDWRISVDKLRKNVFRCDTEYYRTFKRFNSEILQKSLKEVNDRTDINFECTIEKMGRVAKNVRFKLIRYPLDIDDQLPEQMTLEDKSKYKDPLNEQYAEFVNYEFSEEEIELIRKELIRLVPTALFSESTEDLQKRKFDYLEKLYLRLCRESAIKKANGGKPIGSRFKYFLGMLEREKPLQPPEDHSKTRSYDLDEVEKYDIFSDNSKK